MNLEKEFGLSKEETLALHNDGLIKMIGLYEAFIDSIQLKDEFRKFADEVYGR